MKQVLIIDPSLVVRKILGTGLRRAGIESEDYPDPIEALLVLQHDPGPPPAVIILEVDLPRMDGYEVVMHLRKKGYSTTALVMLSKRDGIIDRIKGRLAGANDYLTKPFTMKQVLDVVQHYLSLLEPGGESGAPSPGHLPQKPTVPPLPAEDGERNIRLRRTGL
jgi:twitching motility two-component system response regulator PilG